MASAENILEQSVKEAKKKGIRIVRGPIFIWGKNNVLEACDCFGAVLLARGKAQKGFPKGWLKELCIDILGKDTYWFWRFNYGYSQKRVMQMYTEEKGRKVYIDDEVSKAGMKFAKKVL